MSREDPQLKLRLPSALKQLVENSANDAGRSMNAEIVARLQASFNDPNLWSDLSGSSEELKQVRRELDKARERLINEAKDLADRLVDRMEERGLVVAKGATEPSPSACKPIPKK